jgi:hypothetical protein
MKKVVLALLFVFHTLAFSQSEQWSQWNVYNEWENAEAKRAESGETLWSSYFSQAYDRMATLPYHPLRTAKLQLFAELIPFARKRDQKEITPEQYTDEARKIYARSLAEYEREMASWNAQQQAQQLQAESQQSQLEAQQAQIQAQQHAAAEARRQQGIATGLQLLQMARPQAPAMMPNNSFNCRSRAFGGVVTTNCN